VIGSGGLDMANLATSDTAIFLFYSCPFTF